MLTYLFCISLFLLVTLIIFKLFEIGTKRQTPLLKVLSKLDPSVEKHLNLVQSKIESGKIGVREFVAKDLPQGAKSAVSEIKSAAREKYVKLLPNIRGVRNIGQSGRVSEFLKDIKKDREMNGSGRIDE